ncbi:glycosyltransferase family 4 protein [Massilia sp. NR 4-1]|uniref:glycosyltransferase family 4 protein n=1 Tax=Massilia sp. NR 4-1 TaxID=1678028 RepID=UPI00067B5DA6|nr:glycosyltransferase family 4 protein [Massilia sp. NR 4-1]
MMNILMLGWEFPPHITGGLGTACHGLLKGLSQLGETNTTLVLPRLLGGEEGGFASLVQAGNGLAAERPQGGEMESERLTAFLAALAPDADASAAGAGRVSGVRLMQGAYEGHSIQEALSYAAQVAALPELAAKADVIHAHDWLTFLAGAAVKKRTGKPLVVHVHSTECDRALHINKDIFRIEKFGLEQADMVIAVSEYTRQVLIGRYETDPAKIFVLHNAAEFPAAAPSRSPERMVAFVGRITHQKGPRHFVEAAYQVSRRMDGVRFVMAGSGDQRPVCEALAAAMGMRQHFEFPGFLDADGLRSLLSRADVYVMPSVSEPFGIGALEAAHAGVPVVLSNYAGVAEVMDCVLKVEPSDTGAVADAIVSILGDDELAAALSAGARHEANKLSWKKSARRLLELYRMLSASGKLAMAPLHHSTPMVTENE